LTSIQAPLSLSTPSTKPIFPFRYVLQSAQFLPHFSTKHFIAHRSITPLTQHTTLYRPPLNYSPLSAHNTVSPTAQLLPSLNTQLCIAHRSITPLSQHTTLYRLPLNFPLSQHTTLYRLPLNFSPLSTHNTVSPTAKFLPSLRTQYFTAHRLISPFFQQKTLYRPPLNFPLSQHTTLYRPRINFSPLSAHNTLSTTAQFLPSLSTKHCIAHSSISSQSQQTTL